LTIYILNTCKRIYISGTFITIDEIMIVYRGRSKHITKFKNEPINKDHKIWVLVEYGYIWSWLWYPLEKGTEYTGFIFNSMLPDTLDSTK
jgi:hypothetical protein